MHAMQYEITLPADYDMGIIRHRVATRGERTDSLRGLGLKAYSIREKGVNGSPVNQYAPCYLWVTQSGMNDFLLGPGFAGLCDDFGRPAVRHWNVLTFEPGPAFGNPPMTASAARGDWPLRPASRMRSASPWPASQDFGGPLECTPRLWHSTP